MLVVIVVFFVLQNIPIVVANHSMIWKYESIILVNGGINIIFVRVNTL